MLLIGRMLLITLSNYSDAQKKGYISEPLFDKYFDETFIRNIIALA